MNEDSIIKQYEKLTKSKKIGRLGNILSFKKRNGKYFFINLSQIVSKVRKDGK